MPEEPVVAETTPQEVEECPCEVELKPMAQWVKGDDPDSCRPCTLGPVVQWYWSELNEQGRPDLATRLEKRVEGMDEDNAAQITQVCEELDKVKTEVDEKLRKRLEEFDCAVQSFQLEEGDLSELGETEESLPPSGVSSPSDSAESSPPQIHSSDSE